MPTEIQDNARSIGRLEGSLDALVQRFERHERISLENQTKINDAIMRIERTLQRSIGGFTVINWLGMLLAATLSTVGALAAAWHYRNG